MYKNRVYGYFDEENYSFIQQIIQEMYWHNKRISISKILRLAIKELQENNTSDEIINKLKKME